MKKNLYYIFLIVFSATALLTLLGITEVIFINELYLNGLFGALIIELVGAVIGLFKTTNFFTYT